MISYLLNLSSTNEIAVTGSDSRDQLGLAADSRHRYEQRGGGPSSSLAGLPISPTTVPILGWKHA